jgi:hypothetical protein
VKFKFVQVVSEAGTGTEYRFIENPMRYLVDDSGIRVEILLHDIG